MDKKAKQAAASIDELLRDMGGPLDHLPLAGEECDTTSGWAVRLDRDKRRIAKLIGEMLRDGRAKRVAGRVPRGGAHFQRCSLIWSPTLAKAAELEAACKK